MLAAGTALQIAVFPDLAMVPYGLLAPALAVAALIGGAIPGLITMVPVLGISLSLQLAVGENLNLALIRMGLSAVVAIALCLIAEAYHRAWDRAVLKEKDLRAREAHLEAIVETVPEAIVVFDSDGQIINCNPAAEKIFGVTLQEALGRNVSSMIVEDLRRALDLVATPGGSSGTASVAQGRRANGEVFPLKAHLAPIMVGARPHTMLVGTDMTPMREAALREDLLRGQLAHAWRLNSMGEMAGVLSHEISQPLSANLTYIAVAKELVAAPVIASQQLDDVLDAAASQSRRASEIIRRLRQFVERSDGDQRPDRISDVLNEVEPLLRMAADGQSIDLRITEAPDVLDVWIDRIQIQQVIVNLVRNAVDALVDCERRQILIESSRRDNWVVLSVSDSGSGISADLMDRLMEPFFGNKKGGMGLGLSISKSIMEAHKGFIRASTGLLGGACFEIGLPVHVQPVLEA
jgi:two-component system sensor kinase FixL